MSYEDLNDRYCVNCDALHSEHAGPEQKCLFSPTTFEPMSPHSRKEYMRRVMLEALNKNFPTFNPEKLQPVAERFAEKLTGHDFEGKLQKTLGRRTA